MFFRDKDTYIDVLRVYLQCKNEKTHTHVYKYMLIILCVRVKTHLYVCFHYVFVKYEHLFFLIYKVQVFWMNIKLFASVLGTFLCFIKIAMLMKCHWCHKHTAAWTESMCTMETSQ